MNSLVCFGTLRSKKLLRIIIGKDIDHLNFSFSRILKSKLFKVKNENFPYLEKTNLINDCVDCLYITGLTKENIKKIIFYESIEYVINDIEISLNNKIIKTHFFELIKKNKKKKLWRFEKWKKKYEKLSCIAAKEWMSLFEVHKDDPGNAEIYWKRMLQNAKKKI